MKLINYIQEHHNGNISAFARSQGVLPNQAQRWLDRGCEMRSNGEIWCKITKQVKDQSHGSKPNNE